MAYDKKPDLLDLLKNLDEFNKLSDSTQRQKLGCGGGCWGSVILSLFSRQMLLGRIQQKKPSFTDQEQNQIVGMLIDDQFEIAEILDVLKAEELFDERMKEAEEALRGQDESEV